MTSPLATMHNVLVGTSPPVKNRALHFEGKEKNCKVVFIFRAKKLVTLSISSNRTIFCYSYDKKHNRNTH